MRLSLALRRVTTAYEVIRLAFGFCVIGWFLGLLVEGGRL
jgi:hypothetical protein